MRHPTLRWAQRLDKLFITIDLPNAQDVKLKLEPEGKFFFSAICGAEKTPYEVDIKLYDKVDVDESKASVGMRNILYLVKKAENKWWKRLLKQEGKPPVFLKVDWDKWIDEDEEKENKTGIDMDSSSLNFSNLNTGASEGVNVDELREDSDGDRRVKINPPVASGEPVDEPIPTTSSKPDKS